MKLPLTLTRYQAVAWMSFILLIIWSIPHTIALRYSLMSASLLCCLSVASVRQALWTQLRHSRTLWLYLLLSLWLLIQVPTVALHPGETLIV